jgi:hypothetical protein
MGNPAVRRIVLFQDRKVVSQHPLSHNAFKLFHTGEQIALPATAHHDARYWLRRPSLPKMTIP